MASINRLFTQEILSSALFIKKAEDINISIDVCGFLKG